MVGLSLAVVLGKQEGEAINTFHMNMWKLLVQIIGLSNAVMLEK